jgi:hypothetical protein
MVMAGGRIAFYQLVESPHSEPDNCDLMLLLFSTIFAFASAIAVPWLLLPL